jgi:hypothetical protein
MGAAVPLHGALRQDFYTKGLNSFVRKQSKFIYWLHLLGVMGRSIGHLGSSSMRPPQPIEIKTYRSARLEVSDDRGDGWIVNVYIPGTEKPLVLRNRVPHGLAQLLKEAEAYVDRRLGSLGPVGYL